MTLHFDQKHNQMTKAELIDRCTRIELTAPEGYWMAQKRPIEELPYDGLDYLMVDGPFYALDGWRVYEDHPKNLGYTHFYELPKKVQ